MQAADSVALIARLIMVMIKQTTANDAIILVVA